MYVKAFVLKLLVFSLETNDKKANYPSEVPCLAVYAIVNEQKKESHLSPNHYNLSPARVWPAAQLLSAHASCKLSITNTLSSAASFQ